MTDTCEVTGSCKVSGVTVKCAKNAKGKRKWDKKHYCVYCMKLQSKLARHLERRHAEEPDVGRALSFNKKSAERKALFFKIQNKGDYHHNYNVIEKHNGEIIPLMRPSSSGPLCSYQEYSACEFCYGFVKKSDLWKHVASCKLRDQPKTKYKRIQAASSLLLPLAKGASEGLRENVLTKMNQDVVTRHVGQDSLILRYGSTLYTKHGLDKHKYNYISQKMRELGRLLISAKKSDSSVRSLTDCIDPVKFDLLVKVGKSMSASVPSLGIKLGFSLKHCANILKSESIKCQDEKSKKKAVDFYSLCEMQWGQEVSNSAYRVLNESRWNRPQTLPFTKDIAKLHSYLKTKRHEYSKNLLASGSSDDWYNLAQLTLTEVILFNRRRSGEAGRMELKWYKTNSNKHLQEDIEQCLTQLEIKLAKSLKHVEIRGKRGRKVPVLLTAEMSRNIDLLIDNRFNSGVPEANKFLFAIPHTTSYIRGDRCLAKFAAECGAKRPELLRSTRLRKHVATMSQLLNLREHELDMLAGYLGHDINVHREYYRLPEDTLHLAKVSKLLVAFERGDVAKYAGRTLDDIQIDVDEELPVDLPDRDEEEEDTDEETSTQQPSCMQAESEEDEEEEDTDEKTPTQQPSCMQAECDSDDTCEAANAPPPLKCQTRNVVKKPWTDAERDAIDRHLGVFIRTMKLPGKECEPCQLNESRLAQRPWRQIKYFIYNRIKKLKQTKN
ncbi:PREDICTED: uncharacterized protein LOC106819387 [Priapulus caudatus]|uniref:Uncharacterized protein LOC106819387 n=1 Tax=Priapulus caudatus TaxID=37621 RepID=A0ABM1F4Z4_PRICU|nr:PREDICTED: uncharacterized protein LOC106819387 [Priapulus caudatus]